MGFWVGLKMCSKNIFFTFGFRVELSQNLGFDFSVQPHLALPSALLFRSLRIWAVGRHHVARPGATLDTVKNVMSSRPFF